MPSPMSSTSGMTTKAGTPSRSKKAEKTQVNANVEATEMSMPPVSSTKVMPTETMMR